MSMLGSLAMIGAGLPQGFLFGTGYGAGVRFGYEDVYPYLKGNMADIAKMLNIPFASSGFKLASGVTEHQGGGLSDAEAVTNKPQVMGLNNPQNMNSDVSPSGSYLNTSAFGDPHNLPLYQEVPAKVTDNDPLRFAIVDENSVKRGYPTWSVYEKKKRADGSWVYRLQGHNYNKGLIYHG